MQSIVLSPGGKTEAQVRTILSGATAIGAGSTYSGRGSKKTFHAIGNTSADAGEATIDIEVSNDGTNWVTAMTITLTLGTTVTDDGSAVDAPWRYVRANVTAISGTGATVSVFMGEE